MADSDWRSASSVATATDASGLVAERHEASVRRFFWRYRRRLILPSPALKAIQEIDKNLDAAKYKPKVAELMSAVIDTKIALVDAREEVASKAKEIDRPKGGASVSA